MNGRVILMLRSGGWWWLFLLVLTGLVAAIALSPAFDPRPAVDVAYEQPITAGHEWAAGRPNDAASLALQERQGAAVIELAEDFYDFGDIPADQPVSRVFALTNRGSAALIIQRAYTTCGCTTAEFSASVIPPGKTSLITVHFDPARHGAPGMTLRRGLMIETNDPARPLAEIWIQARLR